MTDLNHDTGTLLAIVQNWDTHTRPRLEQIKKNVDAGEKLSDSELEFLEQIGAESGHNEALFERNPEYRRLIAMAVGFYKDIIERSLENEQKASGK